MATSVEQDALRLPREERVELVHHLLDSLTDDSPGDELTLEQRRELHRRLDAFEADPQNVVTWDEIKSNILLRHQRNETSDRLSA